MFLGNCNLVFGCKVFPIWGLVADKCGKSVYKVYCCFKGFSPDLMGIYVHHAMSEFFNLLPSPTTRKELPLDA